MGSMVKVCPGFITPMALFSEMSGGGKREVVMALKKPALAVKQLEQLTGVVGHIRQCVE